MITITVKIINKRHAWANDIKPYDILILVPVSS